MCEPRLKSQRIDGSEWDAGEDWSSGTSKREIAAIPPETIRETEMLRALIAVVTEAMIEFDED